MSLELTPFDPAEYLDTDEARATFLNQAMERGDAAEIAEYIGIVARSFGMSELAARTGLNRQSLYKALSADGRPEFKTIVKVLAALNLSLIGVKPNAA